MYNTTYRNGGKYPAYLKERKRGTKRHKNIYSVSLRHIPTGKRAQGLIFAFTNAEAYKVAKIIYPFHAVTSVKFRYPAHYKI